MPHSERRWLAFYILCSLIDEQDMSDTIYHLGHEAGSVTPYGATWVTTSGTFDSLYSRCSAQVSDPVNSHTINLDSLYDDASSTGYWIHLLYKNSATYHPRITAIGSGYTSFSINFNGSSNVFYVYAHNSSTYTDNGAIPGLYTSSLSTVDIHVYTSGGNAVVDVYVNGTIAKTGTRSSTTNTGISQLVLSSNSSMTSNYSEVAITNFDTRGLRIKTLTPSSAGHYSEGTGAYTDIDEITPDAAGIVFSATGQRQGFLTAGTGSGTSIIKGLSLNALAATDGTNPLKSLLRVAGTDYLGGVMASNVALVARRAIYQTNPATGAAWSGDLSSIDFGFESVTP